MAGSIFTYVQNTSAHNADAAIETSQGWVPIGTSGLFLPAEVADAQQNGMVLAAGPAVSPASQLTALAVAAGSSGVPNGAYRYCVTFVTAAGETTPGPEFGPVTLTSVQGTVTAIPVGSALSGVTARKLYRTVAAGISGAEKLLTTISDNTTTTYTDNVADGSLGANVPTVDTSFVSVNLGQFDYQRYPAGETFGQEGL